MNGTEKRELVKYYAEKLIEEYQTKAYHKYYGLLQTNPEALRLYDKKNIQVYYYELNEVFFQHNTFIAFVYKTDANLDIELLDLTDQSYYEYETVSFNKNPTDILLAAVEGLTIKDLVFNIYLPYITANSIKYHKTPTAIVSGVEKHLRKEASSFHDHVNYSQGYYAKNAARYSYSELDLNPIIDKVNDDDFSYQLDQAISAYDNSLYLAACATLGVCLETVCKLLLVNNEKKVKDSDATMLDVLSEKLKANHLISYKLKKRIDVCYDVRNLAAHTSPGKVVKSDCHFILNTISEIVEAHF